MSIRTNRRRTLGLIKGMLPKRRHARIKHLISLRIAVAEERMARMYEEMPMDELFPASKGGFGAMLGL